MRSTYHNKGGRICQHSEGGEMVTAAARDSLVVGRAQHAAASTAPLPGLFLPEGAAILHRTLAAAGAARAMAFDGATAIPAIGLNTPHTTRRTRSVQGDMR
jgi:hypothetical protein